MTDSWEQVMGPEGTEHLTDIRERFLNLHLLCAAKELTVMLKAVSSARRTYSTGLGAVRLLEARRPDHGVFWQLRGHQAHSLEGTSVSSF